MLPETASDEDIRQRYLKLANMIHPDKCSHPGAREAFEAVMHASEILKDPKRKEECVHLIKGARKSVIKNHERLIEKGMNPDALPNVVVDSMISRRSTLRSKKKSCACLLRTSSANARRSSTTICMSDATRNEWGCGEAVRCSKKRRDRRSWRR